MKYKFVFLSFAISLFTIKAYSGRDSCYLSEYQNEPRVTFSWKTKCTTYAATYACKGGFKANFAATSGWIKDSKASAEVYEYTNTLGSEMNASYKFERNNVNTVLEEMCASGCYGKPDSGFEDSSLETCTKPDEQMIHFSVQFQNKSGRGMWAYCNANGKEALLKLMYSKAKWEHDPKLYNYHFYKVMNDQQGIDLMKLFTEQREKILGCHL